jgi:putative phosphoribosyl transferase
MYRDRADAGRQLGQRLSHLGSAGVVVLGVPRGGAVVGFEVAQALKVPFDVIVVRKIGVPAQPELAMGALGEGNVRVVNREVIELSGVGPRDFAEVERAELAELDRRAAAYRGGRAPVALRGRTAIVIDDGVATASTATAACRVARAAGAGRVVLAVPVGPNGVGVDLAGIADEVVCLETPDRFHAIGQAYVDFTPTSDAQVIALLGRPPAPPPGFGGDDG